MKNLVTATIVLFFLIATSISASAGRRYSVGSHHGYSGHHYRHGGYHHSSGDVWAIIGAGLLTGIIISAISSNTRERRETVVYHVPQGYRNHSYTPHAYAPQTQYPVVKNQPDLIIEQVKTTPQLLNMRVVPDLESEISGQLEQGTTVDVIGAAPGWLYIKTSKGDYGWIQGKYTKPNEEPVG